MSETFIYEEFVSDLSICDALIDAHKENEFKIPGVLSGQIIDTRAKKSTDCSLQDTEATKPYLAHLQGAINNYVAKYPWSNQYAPWTIKETPSIQHYKPGEGFYAWHCERSNGTLPVAARHMVFMTYLNDVTDGGGTEFYHQKVITEARKGKTLIWPADWTHTHRGVVSPTQDKYIITGWLSYY
jgi:hypothetical protein